MKSRPILFSTPMVLALRDGSKTQTRRVCKTRTQGQTDIIGYALMEDMNKADDGTHEGEAWKRIPCPYGVPGDQLWTRESWCCFGSSDSITPPVPRQCQIRYLADRDTGKSAVWVPMPADAKEPKPSLKGKPSIHMPRWASRDTLELTRVWVERLQDISEEDAMAEGCRYLLAKHEYLDGNPDQYRQLYRILWEQINGPGSWDANPWVWVLEFKRL